MPTHTALGVDLPSRARYNLAVPSGLAVQRRRALVVGLGIDIVDLEEFRAGLNDSLVGEFFLPDEISYSRTQARSWENLGARLAAKRAVFRALGGAAGGAPTWHEVEVVRRESGTLTVRLSGSALALAAGQGVSECRLSMSHTKQTALAVAILEDGRP